MNRRDLIALIGGAVVSMPVALRAQARGGVRRLGVLMGSRSNDPQGQLNATTLVQRLAALGWKEGSNLRIEWRQTGGDATLYERYAAELVALAPDVLLAANSLSVEALRRQTRTIPIVFLDIADPVGLGFVVSLARPGGNLTGFSAYDPPMAGKWLQMLTQITPPVVHVAVLYNPDTTPYAGLMLQAIEAAATSLGVTARAAPIHDEAEIEMVMAALARDGRGGLLVLPEQFVVVHRGAVVSLAAKYRLPAVYPFGFFAAIGGLMSYGLDQADLFRRAATYIDLIFKGAEPGDLPVQAPTKFEMALNLKTAKALGITIPQTIVVSADEVIQ